MLPPPIQRTILATTSTQTTRISLPTNDPPSKSAALMISELPPFASFSFKQSMLAFSTTIHSYRSTRRRDMANRSSRWLLRRCEGEYRSSKCLSSGWGRTKSPRPSELTLISRRGILTSFEGRMDERFESGLWHTRKTNGTTCPSSSIFPRAPFFLALIGCPSSVISPNKTSYPSFV